MAENEIVVPDKRLGKLPAKSSMKALHLSSFIKKEVSELPVATNFWEDRAQFPLRSFGNTKYGCCTRAKQAIAAMRMERIETRRTPQISDEEVIRVYLEMTERLYGGGDTGAYETDALSEWRKPDLTFRDIQGRPLTIDAFVRINHNDINEVKQAIHIAGAHGLAVCLNLPKDWQSVSPPQEWDFPVGTQATGTWLPGSWGGHSLWATDYEERGIILEHTWNIESQLVTWEGVMQYMDEAHIVIDSWNAWKARSEESGQKLIDMDGIRDAVNGVSSQKIK